MTRDHVKEIVFGTVLVAGGFAAGFVTGIMWLTAAIQ